MWKLLVLILTSLNMQASSAAAATPTAASSAPDVKAGADVKSSAAAQADADRKARAEARAALGSKAERKARVAESLRHSTHYVPEVASFVADYDAPMSMADVTADAFRLLKEIYDAVSEHMPSRELLEKNPEGLLEKLLGRVATDDRRAEWNNFMNNTEAVVTHLLDTNQAIFVDYRAMNKGGVTWPYPPDVRVPWQETGFVYGPMMMARDHMICVNGCQAEVKGIAPWMKPYHFHKPDCPRLAEYLGAHPEIKMGSYGENIPKDPHEYWQYTMEFLWKYVVEVRQKSTSPDKNWVHFLRDTIATIGGWELADRYIKAYNPELDFDTRRTLYVSMQQSDTPYSTTFYRKLWTMSDKQKPHHQSLRTPSPTR